MGKQIPWNPIKSYHHHQSRLLKLSSRSKFQILPGWPPGSRRCGPHLSENAPGMEIGRVGSSLKHYSSQFIIIHHKIRYELVPTSNHSAKNKKTFGQWFGQFSSQFNKLKSSAIWRWLPLEWGYREKGWNLVPNVPKHKKNTMKPTNPNAHTYENEPRNHSYEKKKGV